MKDGFDRSVAERMPKMQKRRPNRPWNVEPVLIKVQDEIKEPSGVASQETVEQAFMPSKPVTAISMDETQATIVKAVETIEDLNAEFSQILFEKKDAARKLKEHDKVIEEIGRENSSLKVNLAELEKATQEHKLLDREILFLNEQLEDADYYIKHVVKMLEDRTVGYDTEVMKSKALEERLMKFSKDIQEKAKLDVKVSILEKDMSISSARIHELEARLEEEYHKRKPLEDEISELKVALDRVYSSLSHVRLKAKREVYGS